MSIATFPETRLEAPRPLTEKVVLVTGARGSVTAICKELSERGATVAINYRQRVKLAEQLRDDIRQCGWECEAFQADVSKAADARKLIHDVLDRYHHIDVLVNNAGITRDRSIRKMTDEEWLEVIETDLNSAYYCISAVLPAMIERKYGRIVDVAVLRAGGQFRPGELFDQQGRNHRHDQGAGAGAGEA